MLFFFLLLASSGLVSYANPIGGNTLQHSQGQNPAKRIISTPNSLAAASPTVLGPPTVQTPVKRIFLDTDTCTDAQQKAINQAWEDAELLAQAAAGGRLDYDYTIPKTQWFGKDWNWPGFFPFSPDYRDMINNNIGRQAKLHTPNAPTGTWTYLSCPKKHEVCSPGTIAASADAHRIFWINHYTIFCPLFFGMDSFSTSLDKVRNNKQEQMIMDNYWGNQGYTYFHETYHYGTTVSQPRCQDKCYKAYDCWRMARDEGTGLAYYTADSYSLEAMAIYAQLYFKTPHPPVPRAFASTLTQTNDTLYQEAAHPSNSTPPTIPSPSDAPAEPTQYYIALDSPPEDLFNTTDNVNAAGTNMDPRWKLMVGPPINETSVPASTIAPVQTSTSPPPPPPQTTTTSSPPPINSSSPACQNCENNLGDSTCAAPDLTCLRNQCKNDKDCQTCGIDCSTVG